MWQFGLGGDDAYPGPACTAIETRPPDRIARLLQLRFVRVEKWLSRGDTVFAGVTLLYTRRDSTPPKLDPTLLDPALARGVPMSDEPILRVRSRSSSGSGRALRMPIMVLAAGIGVLALAEVGQGWEMVRLANSYEPPGRVGDLISATLVNGQVFFGTLDMVSRTTIQLRDVFYAQLPAQLPRGQDADAEARTPNVVRRKDNEWTQADVMAIPVERIAFMESVGIDSRMARFIADARSQPPLMPSGLGSPGAGGSPRQPLPSPSIPSETPPKG
jgi:hypothetical protein